MSFLGSPIAAGPEWPSVSDRHFFINHTFFVFLFFYSFLYLLLVTTVQLCPLELTGGLLTNHQCFDLGTTKIY